MKKTKLYLSILFTIGLMVFSASSTLITQRVAAAPAPESTTSTAPAASAGVDELTKAWLYRNAIARCMAKSPLRDGWQRNFIDPSHASSYEWFFKEGPVGGKSVYDENTYPGVINDPSGDGNIGCGNKEMLASALNQLGYTDPIDALCSFGFKRDKGDCVGGSGNFTRIDGKLTATPFVSAVNAKYYGVIGSGNPALTDPMKYYLYSNSFIIGCKATALGPAAGASSTNINLSNTDKGYKMKLVQSDGTVVETLYKADKSRGDKVTISTSPSSYNEGRDTCLNLVNEANKYATAAAAYAVATGDTSVSGSGNQSGDKIDTCNSFSSNPLSWVLCPIYDGLGSFSDWALANVLQPFLRTSPISTDSNDVSYKIWSTFRVYGNIFLVIALLVVVFGQSIGGGLVDAYTAKKVLPRLLVAAVLINLSIYIVAGLVDLTNIVGGSIGGVMTAPLQGQGLFDIGPTGVKAGVLGVTGGIVAILGSIFGLIVVVANVGAFLPFLLLFVIVPAVLALLGVFLTLIFRQALILALILVSPVAFALYCLPNTEQYFRKWWELLFKALLIYPIVMVVFAVADILAVTTLAANGTDSVIGYIFAFLLQFAPLFLIPYAFKVAGGTIGALHGALTSGRQRGMEAVKGNANDPWSRRNRAKRSASNQVLAGRENIIGRANASQRAASTGKIRRGAWGVAARVAGMGNYEELRSRRNAEAGEMLKGQVATGGDSTSRALFANRKQYRWALTDENGQVLKDAQGNTRYGYGEGNFGPGYKLDDKGYVQANKSQFSDFEVSKARNLYGNNPSLYQAALTYEVGKASSDQELDRIMTKHRENVNTMGVHDSGSVWVGTAYSHQGSRRELKHTKETMSDGKAVGYTRNSEAFTREVAENIGTYPLGNMRTSTIQALIDDRKAADEYLYNSRIVEDQSASAEQKDNAQAALKRLAAEAGNGDNRKAQIKSKAEAEKIIEYTTATAKSVDSRRQNYGNLLPEPDGTDAGPGVQSGAAGLVEQKLSEFVALAGPPRAQASPDQRPGPTPRVR